MSTPAPELSAHEKAEVARFGIHNESPGLPEVTKDDQWPHQRPSHSRKSKPTTRNANPPTFVVHAEPHGDDPHCHAKTTQTGE